MSAATSIVAATPAPAGRIEPMVTMLVSFATGRLPVTRTTLINARFGYIRTNTAIRVVAGRATSRADGYYFPQSWEQDVCMAKPWSVACSSTIGKIRRTPETHAHFKVCLRCGADRQRRGSYWAQVLAATFTPPPSEPVAQARAACSRNPLHAKPVDHLPT